ncbi:hypothetical protein DESC_610345 [Desulfosarcina cetonica]|nr:hypothetical protein DESC_610345 [Desulfosarcina cetonica]
MDAGFSKFGLILFLLQNKMRSMGPVFNGAYVRMGHRFVQMHTSPDSGSREAVPVAPDP